ncbi:MAG: MgtC/SapB family protein [Paracoccaceae bacterium]
MDVLSALGREFDADLRATPFILVLIRLAAAAMFGGVIGFEREMKSSSAGLRTHMLISLAACLFALIALELMEVAERAGDAGNADPLRMIEAVTAGVAFLAAGSIISSGGRIKGLTTGAGMWMAGAVGLSCGTGNLALALVATVVAVVVLWVIKPVSERIGSE